MTHVNSMNEIKTAVLELQKDIWSNDTVASWKAQIRYEKLVDRFFIENENLLAPPQKKVCIHDMGYFLSLIESAIEYYIEQ